VNKDIHNLETVQDRR